MMLALSDKVDAPGCNMFDQAHMVLDMATEQQKTIVVLISVGRGVHLVSNAGTDSGRYALCYYTMIGSWYSSS